MVFLANNLFHWPNTKIKRGLCQWMTYADFMEEQLLRVKLSADWLLVNCTGPLTDYQQSTNKLPSDNWQGKMKKNIINKEIKLAARYKMSPNANLVYTDWTKKIIHTNDNWQVHKWTENVWAVVIISQHFFFGLFAVILCEPCSFGSLSTGVISSRFKRCPVECKCISPDFIVSHRTA